MYFLQKHDFFLDFCCFSEGLSRNRDSAQCHRPRALEANTISARKRSAQNVTVPSVTVTTVTVRGVSTISSRKRTVTVRGVSVAVPRGNGRGEAPGAVPPMAWRRICAGAGSEATVTHRHGQGNLLNYRDEQNTLGLPEPRAIGWLR